MGKAKKLYILTKVYLKDFVNGPFATFLFKNSIKTVLVNLNINMFFSPLKKVYALTTTLSTIS